MKNDWDEKAYPRRNPARQNGAADDFERTWTTPVPQAFSRRSTTAREIGPGLVTEVPNEIYRLNERISRRIAARRRIRADQADSQGEGSKGATEAISSSREESG